MTELRDYSAFAEKPLSFPINGKNYTLLPLSIDAGIELAGIVSGKDKAFRKREGVELWKLLLGPLWDEMVTDGVPLDAATRAGLTALAEYQYGRDVAEATWEAGADPNRLAAYMTQKAAAQGNRASRRSNSSGGAKKTPPQASTKATSSPRS